MKNAALFHTPPTHQQDLPSAGKKRPYAKPDFKHEKVFETMALACGKLSATQAQCRFNRKLS
jgi:hypothetical protein